ECADLVSFAGCHEDLFVSRIQNDSQLVCSRAKWSRNLPRRPHVRSGVAKIPGVQVVASWSDDQSVVHLELSGSPGRSGAAAHVFRFRIATGGAIEHQHAAIARNG